MAFLTDLATNATAHGVHVILYSGNDDSLIAHRGTEVVIQVRYLDHNARLTRSV